MHKEKSDCLKGKHDLGKKHAAMVAAVSEFQDAQTGAAASDDDSVYNDAASIASASEASAAKVCVTDCAEAHINCDSDDDNASGCSGQSLNLDGDGEVFMVKKMFGSEYAFHL